MDINSLLSPQSQSSPRSTPPQAHQQPHHLPKSRYRSDGKRTASSLSNEVLLSPPADPPRSTPNVDARHGQSSPYHTPMGQIPEVRTPIDDARSTSRSPFGTPSMQNSRHASVTPSVAANDLSRGSPALSNARAAAAPPFGRTYSASDLIMAEAPAQIPAPRAYSTTSLTADDLETVTTMTSNLAKNSYDYSSHVVLVNLLHQGFVSHSRKEEGADPVDPAGYALLGDLRQAREAMDSRFAIGEDMWRDWILDESALAKVSEDRSAVMELCQKAVQEEPASVVLWSLYGEWVWNTYRIANDLPDAPSNTLSEDDKLICKEIFNRDVVLTVLRNAVTATRWRIDESHQIWNTYAQIVMQDFPDSPPRQTLEEGRSLYMTRLQVPHSAWDNTLQDIFWPFVSKHYPNEWSDIIAATKEQAAPAQQAVQVREAHEERIADAVKAQDSTELYDAFASYLGWEARYKKKTTPFDVDLRCALYERALLRFPTIIEWWLDYIEYRIALRDSRYKVLSVLERATRHCPWSGELWSRRMLQAEIEGQSFNEIESVNLKAGNSGLLETGGVNEMLNVHATWCNYLRRRAFGPHSTEDSFDMAELGIPQVIEGAQITIRKFLGDAYKGDPSWRMEKIYIEFLTRARRLKDARVIWESLVPAQKHSYDFWIRYYNWEMSVWSTERAMTGVSADTSSNDPTLSCVVIKMAFRQEDLDWPEKVHEVYAYHHYTHHSPEDIQQAEIDLRAAQKHLKKRREREALQQAESDAAAVKAQQEAAIATTAIEGTAKRKRGEDSEYGDDAVKRNKVETEESHVEGVPEATKQAKRDREHSTATVRGLPAGVTEKQIRRFFQDCGTVREVSIKPDSDATTVSCTVEFESHEDVLSARTKDGKELDGHRIRVTSGAMSTLYVANYPAEYDEDKIRSLFSSYGSIVSVRFPSLKYNARRRFCYVQFLTDQEALAATELDTKAIDGQHTLVAKISDPERKAARVGAMSEGREIMVRNLHFFSSEAEIRDIFKDCGIVQSVRLIKAANGKFRGTAFIVFATADEASKAVTLNKKPFKDRLIDVSLATDKSSRDASNFSNRPATHIVASTDEQGNGTAEKVDTSRTKHERTVAMLGIPETVNDARIKAFFEGHGALVKFSVHRDKGGVLAEFADMRDAGKVGLGVDCSSLGANCRIVDPVEVIGRSGPPPADKKSVTAFRPAQTTVSRPGARVQGGRRGGLGFKRSTAAVKANGDSGDVGMGNHDSGAQGAKDNAAFRAIFAKGSEEGDASSNGAA